MEGGVVRATTVMEPVVGAARPGVLGVVSAWYVHHTGQ